MNSRIHQKTLSLRHHLERLTHLYIDHYLNDWERDFLERLSSKNKQYHEFNDWETQTIIGTSNKYNHISSSDLLDSSSPLPSPSLLDLSSLIDSFSL